MVRTTDRHMKSVTVLPILEAAPFVLSSYRLSDGDSGTHGKPDDHYRQHMHDLRADGNSGRTGNSFKLTDNEKIRHSVQSLQKIGEQIGQ